MATGRSSAASGLRAVRFRQIWRSDLNGAGTQKKKKILGKKANKKINKEMSKQSRRRTAANI